MITKNTLLSLLLSVPALIIPYTSHATSAWQGNADYNAAPTASGNADNIQGFSGYDFGGGVLLLKDINFATITAGSVITGFFQTYVNSHTLGNTGVSSPNLNISGSGNGYELTMAANFSATVADASAFSVSFDNIVGNAALYFGSTPDYDFAADTGFSNGDMLMSSQFAGGNGIISPFGFGAAQLELTFSSYADTIYGPNSIGSASATFALDANNASQLAGISSVGGNAVAQNDLLFAVDGNMQLFEGTTSSPVPLPMSAWFFGSALFSLVSIKRRKRS